MQHEFSNSLSQLAADAQRIEAAQMRIRNTAIASHFGLIDAAADARDAAYAEAHRLMAKADQTYARSMETARQALMTDMGYAPPMQRANFTAISGGRP